MSINIMYPLIKKLRYFIDSAPSKVCRKCVSLITLHGDGFQGLTWFTVIHVWHTDHQRGVKTISNTTTHHYLPLLKDSDT